VSVLAHPVRLDSASARAGTFRNAVHLPIGELFGIGESIGSDTVVPGVLLELFGIHYLSFLYIPRCFSLRKMWPVLGLRLGTRRRALRAKQSGQEYLQ